MQKELDEQVGGERPVCTSDRGRLPYLDCVINEGMRIRPVSPVLIPHTAMTDSRWSRTQTLELQKLQILPRIFVLFEVEMSHFSPAVSEVTLSVVGLVFWSTCGRSTTTRSTGTNPTSSTLVNTRTETHHLLSVMRERTQIIY